MNLLIWLLLLFLAGYILRGLTFAVALFLLALQEIVAAPQEFNREAAREYGTAIIAAVLIWPIMHTQRKPAELWAGLVTKIKAATNKEG